MPFGVISAGYGLLARRLIPESPRWLAAQGRTTEADRVVVAITGLTSANGYGLPVAGQSTRGKLAELWAHQRPRLFYGMALDFSSSSPTSAHSPAASWCPTRWTGPAADPPSPPPMPPRPCPPWRAPPRPPPATNAPCSPRPQPRRSSPPAPGCRAYPSLSELFPTHPRAGGLWWPRGVEARSITLEALAPASVPLHEPRLRSPGRRLVRAPRTASGATSCGVSQEIVHAVDPQVSESMGTTPAPLNGTTVSAPAPRRHRQPDVPPRCRNPRNTRLAGDAAPVRRMRFASLDKVETARGESEAVIHAGCGWKAGTA